MNRQLRAPIALSVLLCMSACSGERDSSGDGDDLPAKVPLELINNFPVLEVAVGTQSLSVMFDLGGSDQIVLSKAALASLDVELLEETYAWLDAKGNRLEGRKFRIPELRIGTATFRDVTGHEDAEADTYRKVQTGVGYIGPALLESVKFVVDYQDRSMTFIPHGLQRSDEYGCYGTKVSFDPVLGGEPVTRATTDLGELTFVWDTGAPMSLLKGDLVRERGIQPDGLNMTTERFHLSGEDFGPLPLRLFDFVEPAEVDGYIGYDFFASHVVCIDMKNEHLLVRRSL